MKHKFSKLPTVMSMFSTKAEMGGISYVKGFRLKLFYGSLSFGIPKIEMRGTEPKENWLRSHSELMAKLELA